MRAPFEPERHILLREPGRVERGAAHLSGGDWLTFIPRSGGGGRPSADSRTNQGRPGIAGGYRASRGRKQFVSDRWVRRFRRGRSAMDARRTYKGYQLIDLTSL